ncbi:MAG: phage scaffolding protein [Paeniclostridium sordellii]|nr:phage scaffolding protein [Paeniclostridium sordellii]
MEWLKKILEDSKVTDGKLDVEELIKNIKTELPKYMKPKETFNTINEQLKTANKTIEDLKKNNKDNENLQNTIKKYKDDLEAKEKEVAAIRKENFLKDSYRKAGAKEEYLDLLMKTSKLDDIAEVNGEYVGTDKIINTSKEAYKDLFTVKEDDKKGDDSTYIYEPGGGNEASTGSANFIDIIAENQVKR